MSMIPSGSAAFGQNGVYNIQAYGSENAAVISIDNMPGDAIVDVIVHAVSSIPSRIENNIYNNIPQTTRDQMHPEYEEQYRSAAKTAGIATLFLQQLVSGSASALIGYGAYYFTGNATVAAVIGGALYSTLTAAAIASGIFKIIKDAFYSILSLNIRAVNFIYDNGLSLHWHSLKLNAQSIWGSVTAEKLNNIPENKWIHIHPRIVKRLPVEEFNNLNLRIKNKFRDEQKRDILEHFGKLGAFDSAPIESGRDDIVGDTPDKKPVDTNKAGHIRAFVEEARDNEESDFLV